MTNSPIRGECLPKVEILGSLPNTSGSSVEFEKDVQGNCANKENELEATRVGRGEDDALNSRYELLLILSHSFILSDPQCG